MTAQEIILAPDVDKIRDILDQAWGYLDTRPDLQNALVEAFDLAAGIQAKADREGALLEQMQARLTDVYDRLQKAQANSVHSVIAEATIELDVSAQEMRIFLDALKGDHSGLLGRSQMLALAELVQEVAADIAEEQRLLLAEARQLDPDFDPEDDYDPE